MVSACRSSHNSKAMLRNKWKLIIFGCYLKILIVFLVEKYGCKSCWCRFTENVIRIVIFIFFEFNASKNKGHRQHWHRHQLPAHYRFESNHFLFIFRHLMCHILIYAIDGGWIDRDAWRLQRALWSSSTSGLSSLHHHSGKQRSSMFHVCLFWLIVFFV